MNTDQDDTGLDAANSIDWQRRLLLSFVLSVIVVFVSCVIVLALPSSSHVSRSEYLFGLPLAPGFLIVSVLFGEWRAVHQGQIAFIPFISVGVDAFVIFLGWELIRKKWTDTAGSS